MKRLWTLAIALGLLAPLGLVGCSDTNKTEETVKQKGPGGTSEEKVIKETKQSGENPPPPTGASGEPGPKTP